MNPHYALQLWSGWIREHGSIDAPPDGAYSWFRDLDQDYIDPVTHSDPVQAAAVRAMERHALLHRVDRIVEEIGGDEEQALREKYLGRVMCRMISQSVHGPTMRWLLDGECDVETVAGRMGLSRRDVMSLLQSGRRRLRRALNAAYDVAHGRAGEVRAA